jgi:hypothetical protein
MSMQEPHRTRLPNTRPSITHKRTACGVEFYTTVSFYEDDKRVRPAEVFVHLGKRGDLLSGVVDGLCITISLALQYGVPWEKLKAKFLETRFGAEDKGWQTGPGGTTVWHTSILDGIAKAVDWCIQERIDVTGLGEPAKEHPPHSPTPPVHEGDHATT